MTTARVGFIQYEPVFGQREVNLAQLEALVAQSGRSDLLVLPELAATGYEFQDAAEVRSLAEPVGDGPTSDFLRRMTALTGGTVVIGYPEADGDRLYNSAMLAMPGGHFANYRKIHLFSREKDLFSPGDAPPPVIETPAGRVGLMICFDWRFPELARSLALRGAQIIAHPSNLVVPGLCQKAMVVRAFENLVFTITANRIGTESRVGRDLRFTGLSLILNTRGEELASAPADKPHTAVVTIDSASASTKRVNEHNDLFADRQPELYEGL